MFGSMMLNVLYLILNGKLSSRQSEELCMYTYIRMFVCWDILEYCWDVYCYFFLDLEKYCVGIAESRYISLRTMLCHLP